MYTINKEIYQKLYKYMNSRLWLFTLITTLLIIITGLYISTESNRLVLPNSDISSHYTLENNPLKYLANWDGADYIHIAKSGYTDKFFTGFFPFYPILIKLVHILIPSYLISGLIISWTALWGAIYFYCKIIKLYYKRLNINIRNNLDLVKASLVFVLFPSGIYLICAYTESLYAFFALASIYFALSRRLYLTSIFAFLSTITHITGFFILPLIILMLIEEKLSYFKSLLVGAIGSLGIISYSIYLWIYFKNPLEFVHSQTVHAWLRNKIWYSIVSISILDVLIIALLITAIVYWYKRKKSFALYTSLFIAIPIIGGQFDGFARYTLMAFPLQFMVYDFIRNRIDTQFITHMVLGGLWTYSVILFAAGFVTH